MAMRFIADLHIHSHFSRATSRSLVPEQIALWARKKGVSVVGTGDFTHPGWVKELQDKLVEAGEGLYRLRSDLEHTVASQVPPACNGDTSFVLSGEISCIYKKNGKTRKVHHLILLPDMAAVLRLNERLERIGNISSDGRPILGLDSRDLLEIVLEAHEKAFFIPAHIWTPWFSVFGSKSGFDGLEECFEDLTCHIHALETGLSSDPPMNRLLSFLDGYLLVSNSDAHSPAKLGREANIFNTGLGYGHMIRAMTDGEGFGGTVEFFPQEGKYHLDGHRKCQVRLQPQETRDLQEICPVCGRPLTVGVLHRVVDLADRNRPELSNDFFSLVPLTEVLSELLRCGPGTIKVTSVYERLLSVLGPELGILLDAPLTSIEDAGGSILAEAIGRMRRGRVILEEGYDGEYGRVRLFQDSEKEAVAGQMALFGTVKIRARRTLHTEEDHIAPQSGARESVLPAVTPGADPISDPLNPEQKTAVLFEGGHLLVVAGPGTGKTLTLTHRIAHLIRSGAAAPEQILALTFTRKAATEMRQRVSGLLGVSMADQVYITTFHGFCLDVLRSQGERIGIPRDFTLCSEQDSEDLAREIVAEYGAGKVLSQKFIKTLPDLKRSLVSGSENNPFDQGLMELFERYQRRLRELGLLDFDDLEVETLRALRRHPDISSTYSERFPFVLADEYQDTNAVQVGLLKCLAVSGKNRVFAIGDPDQAIYGFRGADVGNFLRFPGDFPGAREVSLWRNYRSTRNILKGAAAFMGRAESLLCESSGKEPILIAPCRSEAEEAEMVVEQVERLLGGTSYFSLDSGRVASHDGEGALGFGDIGVLYRLNVQGDPLEQAFVRAGIPFARSGELPMISRYPVNLLWRFLQVIQYPDNPYYAAIYGSLCSSHGLRMDVPVQEFQVTGSLPDVIDRALKIHGLAETSTDESEAALEGLKRLSSAFEAGMKAFLDTLSLERGIDHAFLSGDRVALMSLHAAKGLEWPVVFITGCEAGLLPCSLFGNRDEEEERRLFYVGMTRARSRLILSHVSRRSINRRVHDMRPSPFLEEIPEDVSGLLDRRGWKPRKRPHRQLNLFDFKPTTIP
jgi:DNA helicase-2/ATP-dependent DNA helicase PcrA